MTTTTQTAQLFVGGQFRPVRKSVQVREAATGEPLHSSLAARPRPSSSMTLTSMRR
jgi:hypothetical protein